MENLDDHSEKSCVSHLLSSNYVAQAGNKNEPGLHLPQIKKADIVTVFPCCQFYKLSGEDSI